VKDVWKLCADRHLDAAALYLYSSSGITVYHLLIDWARGLSRTCSVDACEFTSNTHDLPLAASSSSSSSAAAGGGGDVDSLSTYKVLTNVTNSRRQRTHQTSHTDDPVARSLGAATAAGVYFCFCAQSNCMLTLTLTMTAAVGLRRCLWWRLTWQPASQPLRLM